MSIDIHLLILFGTGFQYRSSLADVRIMIGGADAQALYAGRQGDLVGLDQLNVSLPRSLSGSGDVEIVLIIEARRANPIKVNIR